MMGSTLIYSKSPLTCPSKNKQTNKQTKDTHRQNTHHTHTHAHTHTHTHTHTHARTHACTHSVSSWATFLDYYWHKQMIESFRINLRLSNLCSAASLLLLLFKSNILLDFAHGDKKIINTVITPSVLKQDQNTQMVNNKQNFNYRKFLMPARFWRDTDVHWICIRP